MQGSGNADDTIEKSGENRTGMLMELLHLTGMAQKAIDDDDPLMFLGFIKDRQALITEADADTSRFRSGAADEGIRPGTEEEAILWKTLEAADRELCISASTYKDQLAGQLLQISKNRKLLRYDAIGLPDGTANSINILK